MSSLETDALCKMSDELRLVRAECATLRERLRVAELLPGTDWTERDLATASQTLGLVAMAIQARRFLSYPGAPVKRINEALEAGSSPVRLVYKDGLLQVEYVPYSL